MKAIEENGYAIIKGPKGLNVRVTRQDVDDILVSALEGGINGWCRKAEVVEDTYYGEWASEQVSRGGSLRLYDKIEPSRLILTLEDFLYGLQLWAHDCAPEYCFRKPGSVWFLECGMIDAIQADIIVQMAVFGELVYG